MEWREWIIPNPKSDLIYRPLRRLENWEILTYWAGAFRVVVSSLPEKQSEPTWLKYSPRLSLAKRFGVSAVDNM
jgi:hypothetical protein